jgi:hypothetical protein
MSRSDDSKAIMRVLRRPRDEAQLTQLLAAVAADDDEVAAALARALVNAARKDSAEQVAELGGLPPALRCRAEATLHAPLSGDRHGRVDLRFDDDASDFTLLAELKLHSAYGHDQVARYQRALRDLPAGRRGALIAVTRNVPGVGEPEPGTPQWLGSVRWTDIYEQLRDLPIENEQLRLQWQMLLDVVKQQGDFGVKELNRQDIEGWAAYVQTRETLERLIDDLAPTALEHLHGLLAKRDAWADTPQEDTARLLTRGKEKKVPYPTQRTVQARFAVPASGGQERLRIQFLGGFEQPYFTVEARRYGAPALLAGDDAEAEKFTTAVKTLTSPQQEFVTDRRTYVAHVHTPERWLYDLGDQTTGEALLNLITTDLKTLVESGILDRDSGFDADIGRAPAADEEPVDETVGRERDDAAAG